MKNRRNELASLISDGHVLFSCEGVAESVIVTKLVEDDLTFIDRDAIITNPLTDEWFTRERKGSEIAAQYLRQDYGSAVFVLCVQDQPGHKLSFGPAYESAGRSRAGVGTGPAHPVHHLNITTHPEIEMLIICSEGTLSQYNTWQQRRRGKGLKLKPSLFCKEELGLSRVKTQDFLDDYWQDPTVLVEALEEYRRITNPDKRHDDFMLADLLR